MVECQLELKEIAGDSDDGDADPGTETATGESETDLPADPESMAVTVSGPFDWASDTTATSAINPDFIYEWSWLFTAKEEGDQLLLIELPTVSAASEIETERKFLVDGNQDSRFVQIPIPVGNRHFFTGVLRTVVLVLAWCVGPAFTAPWLTALVKRRLERDKKSTIIIPN